MGPRPSTPWGEDLLDHGRFLRSLARGLTADPARAEDLVQDTWVAALENPPETSAAPRAWLARVLRRLAINRGLRETERGSREQASVRERSQGTAEPQEIAIELELSRQVLESLESLREPYRSTLYLRYYRGLAPLAIAEEQAVPVKTVKTRLARGLELMRAELDRRHGGSRQAWVALLLPLARAPLVPPGAPTEAAPLPVGGASVSGWLVAAGLLLGAAAVWRLLPGAGNELLEAPPERVAAQPEASSTELAGPSSTGRRMALTAPDQSVPWAADVVRLRGRVLDEAGEPLEGAEVRASVMSGAFSGRDRRGASMSPGALGRDDEDSAVRARSDARGVFELELTSSGLALLIVGHDGFAPRGRRLPVFLGQDLDLGALVLDAGVFLSGRVLNELGRPVADALFFARREDEGLTLGSETGGVEMVARSDGQGRFRIARQAPGAWQLEVHSDAHVPAWMEGRTTHPGERIDGIEVVLAPGAVVAGHVRGLAPDELESVLVVVRPVDTRSPRAGNEPRRTLPDAAGAFELRCFSAGEELELLVFHGDGRRSRLLAGPLRVRAGEHALELFPERPPGQAREREPSSPDLPLSAAPSGGSLRIRVESPDGKPAAGALVLRRADARWPFRPTEADVRVTGSDGEVRWEGLAEGAHEFLAMRSAFGLSAVLREERWQSVGVIVGESDSLRLLVSRQGKLWGRAVSGGVPLAGARILIWPLSPRSVQRTSRRALVRNSDADGRFDFGALPSGNYRLELHHSTRARADSRLVTLTSAGESLELEFHDASLSGLVRGPSGQPLAGARVRALAEWPKPGVSLERGELERLVLEGGLERGVLSGERGHFELLGLDPSVPLRLEVSAPGHAILRTSATLPGVFQELSLQPEALLELELVSEELFLRVRARGPAGEERGFGLQPGSSHVLHGLGPGAWTLQASLQSWRRKREAGPSLEYEVVLEAGKTTRMRLEYP